MGDDGPGWRHSEGFWRGFPTRDALAGALRRPFGGRRRYLALAALAVAVALTPTAWRAVQLAGLPDVGEPFDVKAFRAETAPDGRNAFVLYREAAARYKPLLYLDAAGWPLNLPKKWEEAPPEVRAWVEGNREALALYREGAERPDAAPLPQPGPIFGLEAYSSPNKFAELVALEASRLESLGDMDGARGWYRALLRTAHHFASHDVVPSPNWLQACESGLASWAADPRTTPAQIRRAVDDVNACAALDPTEAYLLKSRYLARRPDIHGAGAPPNWLRSLQWVSTFGATPLFSADRLWSHTALWRAEPERARRVARLVTANRLAYYALPPDRRPKPDLSVPFCALYPVGPDAPAAARALSHKALGRWLDLQKDAPVLRLMWDTEAFHTRMPALRQAVLKALTSELARLEPPTSPSPPPARDPVP